MEVEFNGGIALVLTIYFIVMAIIVALVSYFYRDKK